MLMIALSAILISSYLLHKISLNLKIPAALLLLGLGIGLKAAGQYFSVDFILSRETLELMGTFGLILIVLDACLELNVERRELPLIRNAFLTAFGLLILSTFCFGLLIKFSLDTTLKQAFITAIPLAVTSSAIAIPSVQTMGSRVKHFIVYESTFSDILGILLFDYLIQNNAWSLGTALDYSVSTIILVLFSLMLSAALIYLLNKIGGSNKFFLALAVLILIYSAGKLFHWPSLLLVLCFGLMMSNYKKFDELSLGIRLDPVKMKDDLVMFKSFTEETSFVIRTFFFVLLGYSIELHEILKWEVVIAGSSVIVISLLIRYLYLYYIKETDRLAKLFLAPRGLITVVIFYGIPAKYIIPEFSIGIIFFVILVSGLLMTISLRMKNQDTALTEEEITEGGSTQKL